MFHVKHQLMKKLASLLLAASLLSVAELSAAPPAVTTSTATVVIGQEQTIVFPSDRMMPQTFTNATRATTVPIMVGVLGWEADTGKFFIADGTDAGDWSAYTLPFASVSSKPTTLAGYGIIDAQPLDAELTTLADKTYSAYFLDMLPVESASEMRTYLGLEIGANVQAFDSDLSDLADGTLTGTKVQRQMSVDADGSGLKLSGDSSSPGNNKMYGTNGSGVKGWYDAASGGASITLPLEVWVTTNGNNTTGTVGDPSKPYATITEALADLKTANGGSYTRGTVHIGAGVTTANATASGMTGPHTLVLMASSLDSDSNYRSVSLSFAQSAEEVNISGSPTVRLSVAVGGGNTVSLVSPPRNYTLRLKDLTLAIVTMFGEEFGGPPPNATSGNGTDGQPGSSISFEAVNCGIMGDITLRGGAGQPGGTTDDTDQNGGNGGSGGFMSIRFVSCYSTEVNASGTHTIEMQAGGSGAGGAANGAGIPGADGDSNNMDAKFHNVHAPNVSLWDSTDSFSASATVEIIDGCYEYITFDTLGSITIYGTGYSGLGGAVTPGNGSYDWTP
jgi:hypothetical protein